MKYRTGSSWTLAVAGLLLLAIVTSGCGLLNTSASPEASSSTERSISVTGFGEATGTPDIATVQLGVGTDADTIGRAIELSNQVVDQVTQALLDFGIAATDIQSTSFNVYYQDEFDPSTGLQTGKRTYHVDSNLSVTVRDIDRVSAAIQAGLDAGANNVFGLSYGIDDSKALESDARTMALEDAHDRASQLASQLGLTLGDPLVVNELVGGGVLSLAEAATVRGLGGGGGPPLSPGQLTVSIQVDIQYAVDG
jgi:hypothetical protein